MEKEFTEIQLQMLKQMLDWDYEYSYPYSEFDGIAEKKILKKEMRGLISRGYVEMYRGGLNEDGEVVGGSGFSLNYERRREIENIIKQVKLEKKIYQHKSGAWICDLIDLENSWRSISAWGRTDIEAEQNALNLRKMVIAKQLSTNPTMEIENG